MVISLYGIRRLNLEKLIRQHGNLKKFCEATGQIPSYVSHVRHKRRNPGDVFCRSIENALGLVPGWFDTKK